MKPLYCNAYEESICLPAHQQSKSIFDFVRSPLSFNILLHYSFLKKKQTEKCGATIILNNKILSRIFIWEQVDDDTDDCA